MRSVEDRANVQQTGSSMRKTALLHIKFALCATRVSFSSLFIRCYTQQRQQAIPRREIRNNRARLLPLRELQVHGHLLLLLLLLLLLRHRHHRRYPRNSRFARQAKHCRPEAVTKRGPRQCRLVSGSRHDYFNTSRFCKEQRDTRGGRVGDLFERARTS